MDWMRVFYGIQVNTMDSREFRTRPVPHWFFCFSETSEGLIQRMYFVILSPNGMIVEPKVAERLKLGWPSRIKYAQSCEIEYQHHKMEV
jgi:hypothetical protein